MYHDSDKFIIHVEYFSLPELKHQFEHLLSAYRNNETIDLGANPTKRQEEVIENKEGLDQKANLALQTFKAIFHQELQKDPKVLIDDDFDDAIEKMMDWVQVLLPKSQEQESFDTVDQCADRLATLTSETQGTSSHSALGSRWPLVKSMRVYLRAVILSKGLILADLPGLRDSNPVRAKITEEYVRRCDQIFAVVPIERATTNKSLGDIFRLAQDANLRNIDIVCTKSEDVNSAQAEKDWPSSSEKIGKLRWEVHEAEKQDAKLCMELDRVEKDLESVGEESTEDPRWRFLSKTHRGLEKQIESQSFELSSLLIGLRNQSVSARLPKIKEITEFKKITGTEIDPKVFCVSNTLYCKKRHNNLAADARAIELSGIPGLRRHCIGIVADSHGQLAEQLINEELPAFLGSLELWVKAGADSATVEEKESTLETISSVEKCLRKVRNFLFSTCCIFFRCRRLSKSIVLRGSRKGKIIEC